MKNLFYFILLIAYQTNTSAQTALSSDFTYQGNLTLNGIPTDGIFDFDMYLYDAASSGNEVGQLLLEDIEVDSVLDIVRGFLIAKGMFPFSTFRELNITEAKKVLPYAHI